MSGKTGVSVRGARARLGKPLAALLLFLPLSAHAIPTVYFDPVCSVVDPGEEFDVRVMINADAESISTFDVVYRFDPDVITMVSASEGSLYAESPWTTWFVAEEESLGTWEVWDVIFPGGTYVVAPGELARLRFRASANGYSAIDFLSVGVCDIERYPLDPLTWHDGWVCVGAAATGLDTGDPRGPVWRMGLPYPNPTRGSTRVSLSGPRGAGSLPVRLLVFDSGGRAVRSLLEASNPAVSEFEWDGRDDRGFDAASGVYFIRLETPERVVSRRVVLVR